MILLGVVLLCDFLLKEMVREWLFLFVICRLVGVLGVIMLWWGVEGVFILF